MPNNPCFEDAATKKESQYLKCIYCSICGKKMKKCLNPLVIEVSAA